MEKYDKLEKIISSGQTGADLGGLIAAKSLNIPTGGMAPAGYKTETGNAPELATRYQLDMYPTVNYMRVALSNVQNSDATVVFVEKPSAGNILTEKICKEQHKPFIVASTAEKFIEFLSSHKVHTLNVSGNKESASPGITGRVVNTLTNTIKEQVL